MSSMCVCVKGRGILVFRVSLLPFPRQMHQCYKCSILFFPPSRADQPLQLCTRSPRGVTWLFSSLMVGPMVYMNSANATPSPATVTSPPAFDTSKPGAPLTVTRLLDDAAAELVVVAVWPPLPPPLPPVAVAVEFFLPPPPPPADLVPVAVAEPLPPPPPPPVLVPVAVLEPLVLVPDAEPLPVALWWCC